MLPSAFSLAQLSHPKLNFGAESGKNNPQFFAKLTGILTSSVQIVRGKSLILGYGFQNLFVIVGNELIPKRTRALRLQHLQRTQPSP